MDKMRIMLDVTRRNARVQPNRTAVICGSTRYTYKELNAHVNSLSNALNDIGLRKGDILPVFADNCPQYPEILCASVKTGMPILPLNTLVSDEGLVHLVNNARAKIVFCTPNYQKRLLCLRSQLKSTEHYIVLGNPEGGARGYQELISLYPSIEPRKVELSYDDVSYVGTTSGTTGLPKQAMRTYENALACALQLGYILGMTPEDVFYQPCFVTFGAGMWRLLFYLGCTCILATDFSPKVTLETIEMEGVTKVFANAGLIRELVNYPHVDEYNHSTLQRVLVVGAPLSEKEWRQAIKTFGNIFVRVYGLVEQSPVAVLHPDDFTFDGEPEKVKRQYSCGRESLGSRVRVVDEQGNDVPVGELGEVIIQGEHLIKGYLNAPEATREAMREGYFHTGDLARIDEEGYIYLGGRKQDVITTGGKMVLPMDIEALILEQKQVREVAVVGLPDEKLGQIIKAVVVLKEGENISKEELIKLCCQHLPSYAVPLSIDFAENLPKGVTGKLLRSEIIKKYATR
jgi:acyl-CoA synthetase (AMP-forming)/AMP-acid ligase II